MLRRMRMDRMAIAMATLLACASAALPGCGVETYRERGPAPDLSIRMVATDGQEAEVLPRAFGDDGEMLPIARAVVVDADHIRHVRLLNAADVGSMSGE